MLQLQTQISVALFLTDTHESRGQLCPGCHYSGAQAEGAALLGTGYSQIERKGQNGQSIVTAFKTSTKPLQDIISAHIQLTKASPQLHPLSAGQGGVLHTGKALRATNSGKRCVTLLQEGEQVIKNYSELCHRNYNN